MRVYADVTKLGIVIFALVTAIAGYALGFNIDQEFTLKPFFTMIVGLYFLSSGSLAFNQVQEKEKDAKMVRTKGRPLPSGKLKPLPVALMAFVFIFSGVYILFQVSLSSALVGLLSVILYNGFYTLWWKPHWAFAAVPGALPGALPVLIGYGASHPDLFTVEAVYVFLLMFLWQMPHFWVIALKIKDQYKEASFPVLPVVVGDQKTIYYIGLYLFPYLGLAMAAPWFVKSQWAYLGLVIPFVIKIFFEFYCFLKPGQKNWLSFFMWVNVSLLVFLLAPIFDKWSFLLISD